MEAFLWARAEDVSMLCCLGKEVDIGELRNEMGSEGGEGDMLLREDCEGDLEENLGMLALRTSSCGIFLRCCKWLLASA